MGNNYDIGEHYVNVSFKKISGATLNTNAQNKFAHNLLLENHSEISSFGQFC